MALFIFTGDLPRADIERRARALGMDYRDAFTRAPSGKSAGGSDNQASGQSAAQTSTRAGGEKTVREVVVVIPDLFTAQEVGEALAKGGLVASAAEFVVRVKQADLSASLLAGVYRFPEGTKLEDIIGAMTRR